MKQSEYDKGYIHQLLELRRHNFCAGKGAPFNYAVQLVLILSA